MGNNVPPPLAPPAVNHRRFGHSIERGIETVWIKGVTGSRLIHGLASTPTMNSHGYALLSRGCTVKLPVPILSAHAAGPSIGEVFLARKHDRQIYVQGRIWDQGEAADAAWDLIVGGELRAFSGAAAPGAHLQGIVDGKKYYDAWTLREVSICREGANPDCVFEILNQGGRPPYPESLLGMAGKKLRQAAG